MAATPLPEIKAGSAQVEGKPEKATTLVQAPRKLSEAGERLRKILSFGSHTPTPVNDNDHLAAERRVAERAVTLVEAQDAGETAYDSGKNRVVLADDHQLQHRRRMAARGIQIVGGM